MIDVPIAGLVLLDFGVVHSLGNTKCAVTRCLYGRVWSRNKGFSAEYQVVGAVMCLAVGFLGFDLISCNCVLELA